LLNAIQTRYATSPTRVGLLGARGAKLNLSSRCGLEASGNSDATSVSQYRPWQRPMQARVRRFIVPKVIAPPRIALSIALAATFSHRQMMVSAVAS